MIEKRNFTRIAFDASARLIRGENDWPAKLLDISLKGALLEQTVDCGLEIDDPVSVYLLLSDEETEIRLEGHVAHLEGNRTGIACDHIDVDSASHLRRIVDLNTGNEALLEREIEALVTFANH